LIRVPAKELRALPTRFSKDGRHMAVVDEKAGCLLYSLAEQAYVGSMPEEKCSDWLLAPCVAIPTDVVGESSSLHDPSACGFIPDGGRSRRMPDGAATVSWKESQLEIRRDAGPAVKVRAGCGKDGCPEIAAVAPSPDGKHLALGRQAGSRIFVVDVETGKTQKTIKLEENEVILPELLAWGPRGLVAVLGVRDQAPESAETDPSENADGGEAPSDDADAEKKDSSAGVPAVDRDHITAVKMVLWRSPGGPRKAGMWSYAYSEASSLGTLVLDPLGRYLLEHRLQRSDGNFITMVEVGEGRETRLSLQAEDLGDCTKSELSDGRWRSGAWPVWETLESVGAHCQPSHHAWQLYTAPGRRGVARIELKKKPDDTAVRVVKADGKTVVTLQGRAARQAAAEQSDDAIDGGKRWQGTGKNSLKRLSDGEELIFDEHHRAHTAAGAFDCKLRSFTADVFLLGADPLSAEVLHADQVAMLFYHPNLVEDFFVGKSVAPNPALKGLHSPPPRLEQKSIRYLDGQQPILELSLVAHDSGGGISPLRVLVGDAPFATERPIVLSNGTPTPVALAIGKETCAEVSIAVCNAQGLLCSRYLDVPFCPKKKHRLK
jgi:hypothetical protein